MQNLLVVLIHGILIGTVYGGIALGLSIIFGVSRIINFAHGSMLMASTFAYLGLQSIFGINPYIGVFIVAPVFYVLGYFLQRFLINPLIVRERSSVVEPLSLLLITIGLWFTIDNLFMMIFGGSYRLLKNSLSDAYVPIGSGNFQLSKIIAFFGSIALAFGLHFIYHKTELGTRIRAVSQNRVAAGLCGIDVYKTYNIAFGIGVAAVSIAGAFLCQFYYVQPQMGAVFGTKSFMIVILGGLGSIPGAIIGGLLFGIVETVGAQFITSTAASVLTFIIFIVVLTIKPTGLLIKKKG